MYERDTYINLPRLLDKINYVLHRRTFITIDRVTTGNKAYFVPLEAHFPLKSACTHYLTYPNKIGVLNSFPTVEKLNAHFILDPD